MGGAFAGAKLATLLSGALQLVLLAVVMLAAAGIDAGARGDARVDAEPPRADCVAARRRWRSASAC